MELELEIAAVKEEQGDDFTDETVELSRRNLTHL